MEANKSNNLTIFLYEIADALRRLKGTTQPINPQDFVQLIMELGSQVFGEVIDDNTIILLSDLMSNGTYHLKYDNSGGIPLENFAEIATLVVSDSDVRYEDFIDINIPPYMAASIGVYDSDDKRLGFIPINSMKQPFGERLYRFGLLSDIHDYEGSAAEASDDFFRALTIFNDKEDVVMTCICGDITQNGTEAEFEFYANDVNRFSPNTPVYTTTGNHDATYNGLNEDLWRQYTGQERVFELSQTLSNGTTDHFLFLGMKYWSLGSGGAPYLLEDIQWLEDKLEEYRNERCFVFTHLFFPDKCGNLNGIYPESNWLGGVQLEKLEKLNNHYVNSIWFSGHSHWKWYLQKYQDTANIYRTMMSNKNYPECGWCVHVPSCAYPIDSDGTTREGKNLESEGAVVDVYENYIDIRGIDIKNNKYLPIATYRLDTTVYEVAEREVYDDKYLHASDFAYYKGTGQTIVDVEDMPNYFDVTWTAPSQGYYMTNNTFTANTTNKVSITILDCQAFTFNTQTQEWESYPMSSVSKVGFYSGDYNLESTNACYVNATLGVQFQTSSSCPGPWPLKLRMKVQALFFEG